MPVNSIHADYAAKLPEWERARDVLGGEDRIKAAGVAYLPRLDSQTDAQYDTYRARACFFNATARTAEGYLGQIFRAPPVLTLPAGPAGSPGLAQLESDADMAGRSLVEYARDVVAEVIGLGRCGTLVDWDEAEGRAYLSQCIWQGSNYNKAICLPLAPPTFSFSFLKSCRSALARCVAWLNGGPLQATNQVNGMV